MNIFLVIAYDGTDFFGWQKTRMGPSVEQTLQEVLEQILQEPLSLQAASRTDRGVHAEGQSVNFHTKRTPHLSALHKSLNALLPPTIRVLSVEERPSSFHATLHAVAKEYCYQICTGSFQLPHQRLGSWHVFYPLDIQKMEQAAAYFLGEHDFSSFCNQRKALCYPHKRRNLTVCFLEQLPSHQIRVTIKGNQFLYNMVRILVGTLVWVGRGKIALEQLPGLLSTQARSCAGMTAPAHGLTLKRVWY